MSNVPWAGLAALVAMIVIPFLPAWLFEGPRTVKHRPTRHACADCGAPWTSQHACEPEPRMVPAPGAPLRGGLRRPHWPALGDAPARHALPRPPRRQRS